MLDSYHAYMQSQCSYWSPGNDDYLSGEIVSQWFQRKSLQREMSGLQAQLSRMDGVLEGLLYEPVSTLQSTDCAGMPDEPGVYYVLQPDSTARVFLEESTGGHYQNRNPTVSVAELQDKWVQSAIVLNIGKAGPTEGCTLETRLRAYMRFGRGIPTNHWGGRYIWQLLNSGDLLVCWKATGEANPRGVERKLIQEFKAVYGSMPFANIQH